MAKRCFTIIALLFCALSWAQKPAEVMLITDNDLYTSPINDQYYTAGFELIYRYLGTRQNAKVAKRITEFRLGQYIFNPQSVRAAEIDVNDRPFAGYLFAEAGLNTFYQDESVLKLIFQAGVVGPESGAEEVQRGLHQLVGYPTVRGWEYQITTTLGLQAEAFYQRKIFPERYREKVDFHLLGHLNLGTIWTEASVGAMARISFKRPLLPMYHSVLHNAALNNNKEVYKEQREFFLYASPQLQYMNYDATIEGSRFNDDSPVTFPLIPFRFNAEVGIRYRKNNWNYSYSVNYRGKELSNNVISGYYYGSIRIGYFL